MTKNKNNQIMFISISVILCLIIIALPFKAFGDSCNQIRSSVLRLHIIANSDNAEDQRLKLKIRDEILMKTSNLFDTDSLHTAIENANKNMDKIEEIAENVVKEEGYHYSISSKIENSFFKTKMYENGITLPAGYYDALRVVIGKGEGENWWCVMFPPMCLPAATKQTDEESVKIDDVLTTEEVDIAKNGEKYEFKFAVVELFEELFKEIGDWFK